jgi:hypothetical protein
MKSFSAARGYLTRLLGITALASVLLCPGAYAQTGTQPPGSTQPGSTEPAPGATTAPGSTTQPAEPSREEWSKAMARVPVPKKGCFKSSYPKMEWEEVPCAPPSPYHNQPATGPKKPNAVGDGSGDFAAQSTGLISSAVGSFNSITGATNVTGQIGGQGGQVANVFMLQINSQFFQTPACGGVAGCLGWQQFLFSQTQCGGGPCVFMEYWLINFGSPCPAGQPWIQSGSNCWFNGPATVVPAQSVNTLAGMVFTAKTAGGQDQAVLTSSGGLFAQGQDNVLSLAQSWNTAEFNVFGDCCSTLTSFNNGTTIVVKTTINDGTANAPQCVNSSFTAETNDLNLLNPPNATCCPYGGASPAIEFMETNAGHTATCGATALQGDTHLTTVDGTHYDFQAAGEFVSLRDSDGMEIQTRQTPIATTFFPGPDGHDGLATCVAINTAVAARVGGHRVTYQPNISGVPDPNGMQLRVDGRLVALGSPGLNLGSGGRVLKTATAGGLEVDFPDGKNLFVTPLWWASQSKWYLNVDVLRVGGIVGFSQAGSSVRGITGAIPAGSWLPALPNGASMGPMPASLANRYTALYKTYADAWRVDDKNSLFDYAKGTSTATFTMKDWPLQHGPCIVPNEKPVQPGSEAVAERVCRPIADKNMHADCMFDVRATGNADFAKIYGESERVRRDSTSVTVIEPRRELQ